jgi:hypothetical protein
MVTTVLDILGVTCLAALAFFVWPPLTLGVVGAAALLASWRLSP